MRIVNLHKLPPDMRIAVESTMKLFQEYLLPDTKCKV